AGSHFEESTALRLDGLHAADSRSHKNAEALRIDFRRVHPGVTQRELARSHRELGVTVITAGLFRVHVITGIKITHFGPDFRRIIGGVKGRDQINAAFAGQEVFPEGIDPGPDGSQCPETRDDYSLLFT